MRKIFIATLTMLLLLSGLPLIHAQDSITTRIDTPVLIELPIPDDLAPPVTISIDSAPTNGVLTGTEGVYTYQPNTGFAGVDTLTYTLIGADGTLLSQELAIQVLGERTIAAPESATHFTTRAAEAIEFQLALGNEYQIITLPEHGIMSGQIPQVAYIPDANFVGTDTFVYQVSINGAVQTIEITFEVAVNADLPPAPDVPPPPSLDLESIRAQNRAIQGLSPQVAALVEPSINNSLETYSGNLERIVQADTAQVVIRSHDTVATEQVVRELGGTVEFSMGMNVVARMPILSLRALGANENVINVSLPAPAIHLQTTPVDGDGELDGSQGAIISEGVAYMDADDWHMAGITGQGVKVGVIDFGYQIFDTAETVCSEPATMYDGSSYDGTFGGTHGTALVETICDVAPDATIYPIVIDDEVTFVQAVTYLTDTLTVDVIVASLGFFETASDGQTSLSAQAVIDATDNHDVVFVVSNGNMYRGHYEGFYDRYLASAPDGNGSYFVHGFDNNDWGATIYKSEFGNQYFPAGSPIYYFLKWDDWDGNIQNDFDLLLWYWDANAAAWEIATTAGVTDNVASGNPYEFIGHFVTEAGWYRLMVVESIYNATPWIELLEGNIQTDIQYHYAYSSVTDPAAAENAFGVAAVYWGDDVIESYSSSGPANTQYGAAPLPNGYFQPQIAAPSVTSTYVYGTEGFNGTSSAAPHAAGAVALVRSAYPSWTRTQVETFIANRAVDAGDAGADYRFGYGLLQLGAPPVTAPVNDNFADAIPLTLPTYLSMNNTHATLEGGEAHTDCSATTTNTVWYRYTPTTSGTVYLDTHGADFATKIDVYTGAALNSLTPVACAVGWDASDIGLSVNSAAVSFTATASTTYTIAIGGADGATGFAPVALYDIPNDALYNPTLIDSPQFSATVNTASASVEYLEPDFTCGYNPTHTVWYAYYAHGAYAVEVNSNGSSYDTLMQVYSGAPDSLTPVVCDDDDGIGSTSLVSFNTTADTLYLIAVAGFNGANGTMNLNFTAPKGTDTVGIYRASDRSWYLRNTNNGGAAETVFPYGDPSDIAVVGDWDGDGFDTVGIFRNGVFYLKNDNVAGNADIAFGFGAATDLPVAGDWNGDGIDTVGVYRPSTGTWFLTDSPTGASLDYNFQYGLLNETPVAGDWDGDGTDTVGIFRASDRSWYLRNSNTGGNAEIVFDYGDPALDTPVVGDWDGDGTDTVGIYRFGIGEWYLRNSNTAGNADIVFTYGLTNETPVVGDWDGQ